MSKKQSTAAAPTRKMLHCEPTFRHPAPDSGFVNVRIECEAHDATMASAMAGQQAEAAEFGQAQFREAVDQFLQTPLGKEFSTLKGKLIELARRKEEEAGVVTKLETDLKAVLKKGEDPTPVREQIATHQAECTRLDSWAAELPPVLAETTAKAEAELAQVLALVRDRLEAESRQRLADAQDEVLRVIEKALPRIQRELYLTNHGGPLSTSRLKLWAKLA